MGPGGNDVVPNAVPAVVAQGASSMALVPAIDGLTYERTCDRYPTAGGTAAQTHTVATWVVRPYRVIDGVQTYANMITSSSGGAVPPDTGVFSNDAQGNVFLWGYLANGAFVPQQQTLWLPATPGSGATSTDISATGSAITLTFDEQEPYTTPLGTFAHVYHFVAHDPSTAGDDMDEYFVRGLGEAASSNADGTYCTITATNAAGVSAEH